VLGVCRPPSGSAVVIYRTAQVGVGWAKPNKDEQQSALAVAAHFHIGGSGEEEMFIVVNRFVRRVGNKKGCRWLGGRLSVIFVKATPPHL